VNTLGSGDHFGEIGMLYNCPRSATVISENYITCSKISRLRYTELLTYNSNLSQLMRNHVLKYHDPRKIFIEMSLNQVEFFKDLPKIVKNEIIFNMRSKSFDNGKLLYKNGEASKEMYIIQCGYVEITH
jgi:CRP-like cAMP-binding protein